MINDIDVARELEGLSDWRRALPSEDKPYDYRVGDIRVLEGSADLELRQRDGRAARLVIALPSSDAPQYWLYAPPDDAKDWVLQLLTWLDEEVFTSGLGDSRVRTSSGGESYVITEPYGWRLNDPREHARLSAAAGPDGWHGYIRA